MTDQLSVENRGKRLSNLRKLLGLSRAELGKLCNVSPRNLEGWEYGRFYGLSEIGARKIAEGVRGIGCICTPEWLLNGIPPRPIINSPTEPSDDHFFANTSTGTPDLVKTELDLLKQHTNNLIEYQMNDNAMEPIFYKGDYIAAVAVPMNKPEIFLTKPCIVQLPDHTYLVRRVSKGNQGNYFNLIALNQNEDVLEPYIYNVKPLLIAPIIWMRRFLHL